VAADELDAILAPTYLDDLDALPTDELRRRRAECEDVEEGVSYVRRILQGRLDLLRAELERRDDAGDADAGSLVERLGRILGGDEVGGGAVQARSTRLRLPPKAALFEAQLEAVPDEAELADLPERDSEAVRELVERLTGQERELSAIRRQLFDRIDRLRDELAERYKDGRATVGDLLGGS
jgi:hypothetical protein